MTHVECANLGTKTMPTAPITRRTVFTAAGFATVGNCDPVRLALALCNALLLAPLHSADKPDPTPAEIELKRQLGPGTPDALALWPGKPPRFLENAPAETVVENARIRCVSVPTITPYLPPKDRRFPSAGRSASAGRRQPHAGKRPCGNVSQRNTLAG